MTVTVQSRGSQEEEETDDKKKEPLYLNLAQTLAKEAHEKREKRRKTQPQKTILEMYKTVGAVNGPGWRPKPDRPVLETSVCLMLDN